MTENMPSFVAAAPGWDALTRTADGYDATPVIAWAFVCSGDESICVLPVTAAQRRGERVVCAPDGRVIDGDREWDTITAWLGDTPTAGLGTRLALAQDKALALDTFRGKFQKGD